MNGHSNDIVLTLNNMLKCYAVYYKVDVREAELGIQTDVRCPSLDSARQSSYPVYVLL